MLTTAPPKFKGRKKEVFGKFLSKPENTKSQVILISNFALLIIIMIYNGFTFSQVFSGFFVNHWINKKMARSAGVEPTTFGFGGQHSIHLSYERMIFTVSGPAGQGRDCKPSCGGLNRISKYFLRIDGFSTIMPSVSEPGL
jgi:hypothetical protein